jgi:phosphoserine phosphatase
VSGERLAVFDVCDTLYACNTTVAFVRYAVRRIGGFGRSFALGALIRRSSPVFLMAAAATKLVGADIGRALIVGRLSGYEKRELERLAADFVADELARVANEPVHRAFRRHVQAGDRTLLLSNSLDLVVDAVARPLDTTGIGSPVAFRNGVCLGRVASDLHGCKPEALKKFLGGRSPRLTVYTDNLSDRALLEMADHRNIVIPRGASRRPWGHIDADFIEL